MEIKTYWIPCDNNWGDIFSENIFSRLYNIQLLKVPPTEAQLFCTGSILTSLPSGYSGHILGTGAWDWKDNTSVRDIRTANTWLLRGKLTRNCYLTNKEPLLGDPGILAYLFAKPCEKQYELGVIPHYVDKFNPEVLKWKQQGAHIIDIQSGFQNVIDEANKCKKIVSSSLHGLILCDSLGIPNRWVGWDRRVLSRGFKFNDYYSVYNEKFNAFSYIEEGFEHCHMRDTYQVKLDVKKAFDSFVEFVTK